VKTDRSPELSVHSPTPILVVKASIWEPAWRNPGLGINALRSQHAGGVKQWLSGASENAVVAVKAGVVLQATVVAGSSADSSVSR
jgi:hypothetical protein